jgi:hypothetical protein
MSNVNQFVCNRLSNTVDMGIGKEKRMFPNRAKVSQPAASYLWLAPALALALVLLLTGLFAFSSAQAQTASGELCIEGVVIDHEEEPLGGLVITLTNSVFLTTTSAEEPDEDEDDPEFLEGEFEFEDLPVGVFTLTVEVPPGFEGVTPISFTVELEAGMDDCLRVRFKLRQIIPVTVFKIDADHNPLPNWTIKAIPGPGNFFAIPMEEETDISGTVVFTLTPGVWIFVEKSPSAEDLGDEPPDPFTPVLPPGGKHQLDVQPLNPGDPPYFVVFKNEFKNNGCIIIRKFGVVPMGTPAAGLPFAEPVPGSLNIGYGAGGWGFQILRDDGSIARQGVTDAEGFLKFENLPYGPYTVAEEDRPGWDELTPRALDVVLDSGGCVLVPFENEQDESGFCIEGYKLDVNGGYGIAGWVFEIDSVYEGGPEAIDLETGDEVDEAVTDGTGKFRFDFSRDDYRVPGGLVEICEDDDVDGWVPHTPLCARVELPKWPGECVQLEPFVNAQVGHDKKCDECDHKDADHKDGDHKDGNHPDGKGGPDGYDNGGQYNGNGDQYGGGQYNGKGGQDGHDGQYNGNGDQYGGDGQYGGKSDSYGDYSMCSQVHEVVKGEGLFAIGESYDVSAQDILDANSWVRDVTDYLLQPGQKVCIP